MSIALSALVSRLQSDVPARNDLPSSAQYEQAIKDAVSDYSGRRPLRKLTTLSIVSGTSTYDLPDDFLKVIRLESLLSQDGVIHSRCAWSQIRFKPKGTLSTGMDRGRLGSLIRLIFSTDLGTKSTGAS